MDNKTKNINMAKMSRRNLLKVTASGLLAGIAAPVFPYLSSHAAETGADGKKVLVTYYSHTGNTREIANQIHKSIGGDIFEIQGVKRYPDDYEEHKKQAKEELASEYKPPLKTKIDNAGSYDLLFIGYPIWWGTFPAPVRTFLSEYDFSGKIVVPFCTHLGSGLGRSVRDIETLCPNSTILDGLAVWGRDVKDAQNELSGWLGKIKITQ